MQYGIYNVLSVGPSGFKTSKSVKGMYREITIGSKYGDHCIPLIELQLKIHVAQ
jgi:hypothetical protein